MKNYHNPVLLKESIEGLDINPVGVYVDVTFGGGGHSKAILNKLSSKGKLFAFDQDHSTSINSIDDSRFKLISANFSNLKKHLNLYDVSEISGLIADFGVSSYQLDKKERGFSIRFNGPLDMRMDNKNKLNAKEIVNSYNEKKLTSLFKGYGEVSRARIYSKMIVKSRIKNKIISTKDLQNVLEPIIPKRKLNKEMAKIFQAIRIEVNNELECLKEFLNKSIEILNSGGKLIIISFHSLEDRIVKNFMKHCEKNCVCETTKLICDCKKKSTLKILTKKPIRPSQKEILVNPNSRSAKLRVGAVI